MLRSKDLVISSKCGFLTIILKQAAVRVFGTLHFTTSFICLKKKKKGVSLS